MIRVLIADDHQVVRSGLEQLLATADDIELVAMAADGAQAVALVAEHHPDIVLMDLSMPQLDGVEATRRITGGGGVTQVVVLTSFSDQQRILDALDAGAAGYVLKHAQPDELLDAIRAAHQGGAPAASRGSSSMVSSAKAHTRRENATRSATLVEASRYQSACGSSSYFSNGT